MKRTARGIHGTLFYIQDENHLETAKGTWPTRRECEVFPSAIREPMRELFARERKKLGLPDPIQSLPLLHGKRPSEKERRITQIRQSMRAASRKR